MGFGTIVGSAVFNVLFVIAMCGFFAKELLDLSWSPDLTLALALALALALT